MSTFARPVEEILTALHERAKELSCLYRLALAREEIGRAHV